MAYKSECATRHNKWDTCLRPQQESTDSDTLQHWVAILLWHCHPRILLVYNSPFAVQLPSTKHHTLNFSRGSSLRESRGISAFKSRSSLTVSLNSRFAVVPPKFRCSTCLFHFNSRTSVPSKRKRLKVSNVRGSVKAVKKVKWSWQYICGIIEALKKEKYN